MLAVDGPSGAGKTTLARAIARGLAGAGHRARVLSLDLMYDGWAGLTPELERRVCSQVLEPLSRDEVARWRSYDWAVGCFGEWRELPPGDVLVLEGCDAGARIFAPYTTVLVWVEAATDVRARRAVERDGPAVLDHWVGWAAAERRVFARNGTRSRADVRLRT